MKPLDLMSVRKGDSREASVVLFEYVRLSAVVCLLQAISSKLEILPIRHEERNQTRHEHKLIVLHHDENTPNQFDAHNEALMLFALASPNRLYSTQVIIHP